MEDIPDFCTLITPTTVFCALLTALTIEVFIVALLLTNDRLVFSELFADPEIDTFDQSW